MRHSRPTTSTDRAGFTLVELLVVLVVGMGLLGAFSGFNLAEQRALRRHQVEIASSQSLRNALEQMSRDLRSAGLDPTGTAGAGITLADVAEVDFTLDGDASGAVSSTDPNETKKFNRSGTTIQSYQAGSTGSWVTLADYVAPSGTIFAYYRCDGTEITTLPASATDRAAIARIDITLTVNGVGGVTLSRTEAESVRLRNKVCP